MSTVIYIGQNITKDTVAGDRAMNRYAIFNGLERPRRIDSNYNVQILGVGAPGIPTTPTPLTVAGGGLTGGQWYAYRAVYASIVHSRPVAVVDGSGNLTRGNPSPIASVQLGAGNNAVQITVPSTEQAGITHVLLYRSLASATQGNAEAGPFYFSTRAVMTPGATVVFDLTGDAALGVQVETDNFAPNAYRYAVAANGYIFAGGNFPLGSGLTCQAENGSSYVNLNGGYPRFYDGIQGWNFRFLGENTGGIDGTGRYYANYVDGDTVQLIDEDGDAFGYTGASSTSKYFYVYLPGFVLRWSKNGEPEAWPATNLINFDGDITGIAQLPNQPRLLVCTDTPSMYVLDLTVIGSDTFKTARALISTEHTVSSHWSLCPVEGMLRGIDASKKCIVETDGSVVRDISAPYVPKIFEYLDRDMNRIKLWHCAYDQAQKLFGAFVAFQVSHRTVDFCSGQHVLTGGWFFNWEKDLLSTGYYTHPATGESIVLGGTEGPGNDRGGIWGRIWHPQVFSEWIPWDSVLSGTIASVTNPTTIVVDTSGGDLSTLGDGLAGRWVLVCNANGEYAQVGYIDTNTPDTIVVGSVMNGLNNTRFQPVPEVGWKFYLGLIEMRWGPKRFDMNDPDLLKKVWEVWCTVSGHNESDPPFFRLYRGFEQNYTSQLPISERRYLDGTENQSFVNKVSAKLEPVPRWGVAWYDRAYSATTLHGMTIVFNFFGQVKERKKT